MLSADRLSNALHTGDDNAFEATRRSTAPAANGAVHALT
jgi:hypothetical protein